MPTINVVFLLLLFFLLAGTLTSGEETAIDPARVAGEPGGRLPRPLLTVDPAGALHLDGIPVPRKTLALAVAALPRRASDGQPRIHVLAARGLAADDLVALLAELAASGAATSLVALDGAGERRGLP
ncbi:biopolymer transporter ExbD [Aurantimonas sp. 22II-16-19i]|uniref:biopolymer transporter ExbD n=1 Tax=Aurantimonas sp. 22II-16-19i TaxID=1317114 RepID=UPI00111C69FB|nr:biopolymer transporter ExbD [Aurantimonas sp. 22II-16-19i]